MATPNNQNPNIPPHDIDAEKSVLGSLLIDRDAIVKVVDFLRASHFYRTPNARIYEAIMNLYDRREPTDLVTLPGELKNMKVLDDVGGVVYLTELVNSVPTSSNVEYYARIIRDHSLKRQLLKAAGNIGELVFQESNVEELFDRAEQMLFSISQSRVHQDFSEVKDILEITFERLDALSRTKGALRGVPTGLATLDRMLSGLQKENLVILAARPSVGKSSFAINIGQFAATRHKMCTVIFSLEMGKESIVDRMIAAQGNIDNFRISTGNLDPEDFEKYAIASGELAETSILIDDTPGISVMEMRTKARRIQLERKIDLIVVDYLQLVRGRNLDSRVQEVSEISQALKNLARELKVPVLALSQLSRAVEQRGGDKKPQLSDLRDSGSIEQDADVVMFLYRPNDEDRINHKLFVAKHRNGPTGELDLVFKPNITKFFETSNESPQG